MTNRLKVALHPSVASFAPEAKYVLRTLATLAGFATEFTWANTERADVYYGPEAARADAAIAIESSADFTASDRGREPYAFLEDDRLSFLEFSSSRTGLTHQPGGAALFTNDIVRGSFWLLTGAMDSSYARDNRDNLDLSGSFFLKHELQRRPLVSQYASFLREYFRERGMRPASLPWTAAGQQAGFAFSHDVDYPQMIKWIECARLLRSRGAGALPSIRGVLNGSNHFWQFANWIEFEKKFGTRPAFYFSARRGSLLQYASGTPDCFYDIFSPEFKQLFRMLLDEGCEIGLHSSYNAYHDGARIAAERHALRQASGASVAGGRHHYWRLNPAAPHETLARHQQAGLSYDSSLGFEFYPGFRRGTCHPFHPWHPDERRELKVLQIPPAWMDDHFDRRLAKNGVADPEGYAAGLLKAVKATGGIAVVDYHVRGMNRDFFPRYGAWLEQFAGRHFDSSLAFRTPAEFARLYREYEEKLLEASADRTLPADAQATEFSGEAIEVSRMRPEEVPAVAKLHYDFFGHGQQHGHSIVHLGLDFLEEVFYRLNLDNPYLFVDVTRHRGEIIGYSVYASDARRMFRETVRRHPGGVARAMLRVAVRRPLTLAGHILGNLSILSDNKPEQLRDIHAWHFLFGVKAEYRTREFREKTGRWISGEMWNLMERTFVERGIEKFWTVVAEHNKPMNELQIKSGAKETARGLAQGMPSIFYTKNLKEHPPLSAEAYRESYSKGAR